MNIIEHGKSKNYYMNVVTTENFDRMKWRVGMIDYIIAQQAVKFHRHFPNFTILVDNEVCWDLQALSQDTDIGLTFKHSICRNSVNPNL